MLLSEMAITSETPAVAQQFKHSTPEETKAVICLASHHHCDVQLILYHPDMLDRRACVVGQGGGPTAAWRLPSRDVHVCAKYRRIPARSITGKPRLNNRRDGRRGQRAEPGSWDEDEDDDADESSDKARSSASQRGPDEAALLRELNSSSESAAALLQAFDGESWGTDDINDFARIRSETDPLPPERSPTRSPSAPAARSASASPALSSADAGSSNDAAAAAVFASSLPAGVHMIEEGTGLDMSLHITVQPVYALRNDEVMSALSLLNLDIRVEDSGSDTEDDADDLNQPLDDPHTSSYLDADLADIDISGNVTVNRPGNSFNRQQPTAAKPPVGSSGGRGSGARGEGAGGAGGREMLDAEPEVGAAWMSELQELGMNWTVQRSPTGEVYLETQKRVPTAKKQPTRSSSPTAKQSPPGSGATTAGRASAKPGSGSPPLRRPAAAQSAPVTASPPRDNTPPVFKPSVAADPKLKPALRLLRSPEQVLDFTCMVFPKWASAGCRLAAPTVLAALPPGSDHVGNSLADSAAPFRVVPTPWEAAQILQGLALAARKAGWGAMRRLDLCRDVRVVGLIEALRTQPPRLSPDQEASPALAKSLTSLFSSAARTWWLSSPPSTPSRPSLPQFTTQPTTTTPASATNQTTVSPLANHHSEPGENGHDARGPSPERLVPPTWSYNSETASNNTLDSSAVKLNGHLPHVPTSSTQITPASAQQDTRALLNSAAAAQASSGGNGGRQSRDDEYSQLLARYLNSSQEEATQKAVRHQTILSGLWAMASLAGAVSWQTEMEGLLRVAAAGATNWQQSGPGDMGSVAWALATAQHWTPQLARMAAVCGQTGDGVWPMAPDEIARLLWAYATLNHPLTGLPLPADWAWRQGFNRGDVKDVSVQQLAVCCWALAVRRLTGHPAFKCAWHALLDKADQVETAGHVTLTQVWQVALEIRLTGKEGQQTFEPLSSNSPSPTDMVSTTITAAMDSYVDQKRPGSQVEAGQRMLRQAHTVFLAGGTALAGGRGRTQGHSNYQRQIGNTLVALHHMHVMEDVSSGYAVDLSLPRLKVAIEADGPSHFSRVPGPRGVPSWPLGATAMKRRHLKAMGWALVSIATHEWDTAGTTAARQAFLNERITSAVQERMDAQAQ